MKLNADCIRDILLYCEECCTTNSGAKFNRNTQFVKSKNSYEYAEILYHLRQCDMSGFFSGKIETIAYYIVSDLTPAAHEFLANIREETNWEKTKAVSKKVGTSSLSAIKDIAAQVIAAVIAAQFK